MQARNPRASVCLAFDFRSLTILSPDAQAVGTCGVRWGITTTKSSLPLRRQTKVTLQCGSEDELLVMQAQAQSLNLCAKSIQDA